MCYSIYRNSIDRQVSWTGQSKKSIEEITFIIYECWTPITNSAPNTTTVIIYSIFFATGFWCNNFDSVDQYFNQKLICEIEIKDQTE